MHSKLKKIKKICDGMLEQLWKEGKFYPELADKNYHAFISGFRTIDKIIEEPTDSWWERHKSFIEHRKEFPYYPEKNKK
jgi:hypothetical protein